jgi:Coenzyme PQQ synthesis protein D (PqqD)
MPSKADFPGAAAFADQLEATPIKNEKAVMSITEADAVRVSVPLIYPAWLRPVANVMRFRKQRSYELEGVGRAVYDRVDGQTSVAALVDWLATEHQLSFHEARVLIMKYLQMLMERGLIVIAGKRSSTRP